MIKVDFEFVSFVVFKYFYSVNTFQVKMAIKA